MNQLKKPILLVAYISLYFASCKKKDLNITQQEQQVNTESALVRKDAYFPEGVLQFKSSAEFEAFLNKLEEDPDYAQNAISGFKTFKTYFDQYMAAQKNKTLSEQADTAEFIMDAKSIMLPSDQLSGAVNKDMQVIVGDSLYHYTRIGLFKVNLKNLPEYATFYKANTSNLFFNANYNQTPNERLMSTNEYLVLPGVTRTPMSGGNVFAPASIEYVDDKGGWTGSSTPPNENYLYNTTNKGSGVKTFDKELAIPFRDFAKRRFVFKIHKQALIFSDDDNINFACKVQREKRFLGVSYWGPSNADDFLSGWDNVAFFTDKRVEGPLSPNRLATFEYSDYQGFYTVVSGDVFVMSVNNTRLAAQVSTAEFANFANDKYNAVIGGQYINHFAPIETAVRNSYDSTFKDRLIQINAISLQNQSESAKFVCGKKEYRLVGGNHHTLFRWLRSSRPSILNVNTPFRQAITGDFKAGSFYAKMRVGNRWRGIRVVCQP